MSDGAQTSEFQLTKYVFFAGMFLDAVGILLEQLQIHFQAKSGFLPVVLVVVGSLMSLAKALGYTRSRTMVKLQEAAPVAVSAGAELVPLFKELLGELKAARGSSQVTPPSVVEVPLQK